MHGVPERLSVLILTLYRHAVDSSSDEIGVLPTMLLYREVDRPGESGVPFVTPLNTMVWFAPGSTSTALRLVMGWAEEERASSVTFTSNTAGMVTSTSWTPTTETTGEVDPQSPWRVQRGRVVIEQDALDDGLGAAAITCARIWLTTSSSGAFPQG